MTAPYAEGAKSNFVRHKPLELSLLYFTPYRPLPQWQSKWKWVKSVFVIWALLWTAHVQAAQLILPTPVSPEAAPAISVKDIIELTTVGSWLDIETAVSLKDLYVVSPDGKHIAMVTKHGILSDNSIVFDLLIFEVSSLPGGQPPDKVATFVSKSSRPGISGVTWMTDSKLAFIGEAENGPPQVFSVEIGRSGRIVQLTHSETPIKVLKKIPGRDALLYIAEPKVIDVESAGYRQLRERGFVVPPDKQLSELIGGKWDVRDTEFKNPSPSSLHVFENKVDTEIELPRQYGGWHMTDHWAFRFVSVAPDGKVALLSYMPDSGMAPSWSGYTNEEFTVMVGKGAMYRWWILIDLQTGETRPLTGGPSINVSQYDRALWAPDGRSVIIVNDLLPLDSADPSRANDRLTGEVDVYSGLTTVISREKGLKFESWDPETGILSLSRSAPEGKDIAEKVRYQRTGAGWTTLSEVKSLERVASNLVVDVEQGMNEPWKVVASKASSRSVILDPNPGLFSRFRFSPTSVVKWETKSGGRYSGLLYWPHGYTAGRRYPLLIQTHGYNDKKFQPNGFSTTGYAAQPLATRGIAVLQISREDPGSFAEAQRPPEGQLQQEEIEGAIDFLDSVGLIDRQRVGLQGFSLTVYHVLYFLTHSKYPIAAATCIDGVDGGYMQYMFYGPTTPNLKRHYEWKNGGQSFSNSPETWLKSSPSFNLKNVSAPLLVTAQSFPSSLLSMWEPYAGLLLQGKPVEMAYIPDAEHEIIRPWERMRSQQNDTVDWYRFWLQDYERNEPIEDWKETKKELQDQYERWHRLRGLRGPSVPARTPIVGQR